MKIMFGKFKDKLKGWFSKSKETLEETAEVIEKEEVEKQEKQIDEEKEKLKKEEEKLKQEERKLKENIKKEKEKLIQEIKKKKEEIKEEEKLKEDEKKLKQEEEKLKQQIQKEKEHLGKEKQKELEQKERESEEQREKELELAIKKKEEEIKAQELALEKEKEELIEEEKEIIKEKEEIEQEKQAIKQKEEEIQKQGKKSLYQKIKSTFSYKITEESFDEIFDDLEMLLLENNVALEVVEDLKHKLSKKLIDKEIKKDELEQEIKNELKNSLNEILIEPDNPLEFIRLKKEKPFVILFFGINGTGKTTSIAKIAHFLKKSNISVVLAAGDTFRAASIEQIAEHAKKLDVPLIKHDYESDPAAVGFDAIKYAENHNIDVVLIDTAGRMHTKSNLIAEMGKIARVTKPDLKLFVAESIAGNDATEQAKTFHEAIEIDGSILSKADIDEKGGTIISVSHATGKPIFYLGTGQKYEDLELFNKQKFIESLGL